MYKQKRGGTMLYAKNAAHKEMFLKHHVEEEYSNAWGLIVMSGYRGTSAQRDSDTSFLKAFTACQSGQSFLDKIAK